MSWVSCQIVLLVSHTHFSWTFGVASHKGNGAKLHFGVMWKTHFFSSSSCYSTHDYNFEYVCLCFLLYIFVARKLVMFVPPHIAHRGGLSSVSLWLHHCKLWKEEEEVVVHNSQPLLFTLFWSLLHRRWQWQKEECPSFGHFLSFHYCRWWQQKENVQIDFFGFVVWSFHVDDDDMRRNMVPPLTFFCFVICTWIGKKMWQVFFLLGKMDINYERKNKVKDGYKFRNDFREV